ncbi:MAG TPA: CPBP family intramembrane glutamic endopeptidase [Terracidiphilus sp.]|nr:CPBP family intramembrane glutamic endopeptidase [Terracidiphilus sp.]
MALITPVNVIAALLTLVPYLAVAFFPDFAAARVRAMPIWARLACPAALAIPYLLVACGTGVFRWGWFALYALVPVGIALLLGEAARVDAGDNGNGRGNWRDFLVLAVLGLAVDLRWFEGAWPAHLAIFNKILLLDAGIYGFVLIRQLGGTGFNLRLRLKDLGIGLRETVFYTPLALGLGLSLGFLHVHGGWPGIGPIAFAWFFTFFFIAVPEELFFRGWLQNLLEKRLGRYGALFVTACLFGLAHFNKRAAHFNWQYVLLAALAGIFYGRAWRAERRVGASAVTHATVDAIWSLWLR